MSDLIKDAAEAMARRVAEMAKELPTGIGLLIFMIADMGSHYETRVVASMRPDDFAPVVRRWLERYDAGEATEFKTDA